MTTRRRNRLIREARVTGALLEQRKAGLRASIVRLGETGRVLSAANEEQLRVALDSITQVLAALEKEDAAPAEAADKVAKCETCDGTGKIREGQMECPDCKGTGEAKKEARRSRLLGLAESYSSAADDASDCAYILSSLLSLMGDEADEPDELGLLQGAYALLQQWMALEVASIGTPDDMADSAEGDPDDYSMWGWEAARAKLAAAGGLSARPGTMRLREGKPLKGDLVPVAESAIRPDGTGAVKVIAPGWGSSGYYSEAVLRRDGPAVFPEGTKMFWDHPTLSEEFERPERSLRDLAGEFTGPAYWDAVGPMNVESGQPLGPGLYAPVKVYEGFAATVNEIAPAIGVSIRAYGKATVGEAEGQTGQLITELVDAESVDFVTTPGAGGQVLQLFEAARQRLEPPAPKEAAMEVEKDPKFVEMATRAARAEERIVLTEAREVVAAKLAESKLPEITRARLAAVLAVNPPAKDGALDKPVLEKRIDEAVASEAEYLAKLTGAGQIRGMGDGGGQDEDVTPALESAFRRLGQSDAGAKVAAAGRSK